MYAFHIFSSSEYRWPRRSTRHLDRKMHKKTLIKQYWRNRNGATVVEYALILAIISVILVMALPTITPAIAAFFGALSAILQS